MAAILLHQQSPKPLDEKKADEADLLSAENTRREEVVSPYFIISITKWLPGTGQQHECSQVYCEFSVLLLREESHKGVASWWLEREFNFFKLYWGEVPMASSSSSSYILTQVPASYTVPGDVSSLSQTLSRGVKRQRLLFPCQQRVTEYNIHSLQV